MNVGVIGAGHVGLVTAACFAELGNKVICCDNDVEKIKLLKQNKLPIYEPQLEALVKTNQEENRLYFTDNIKELVDNSVVMFICVGTPPKEDGSPDLSYVENVAYQIGESIKIKKTKNYEYKLIVEKSTVPVETSKWLKEIIKKYFPPEIEVDIASNPEFLREGSAVFDFMHPDRIIIGVESEKATSLLIKLYEPLNAPILITDVNSAELIKHASNAFLAMKISFINAVANICEAAGADIEKVAKGIGLDKRIGESFLKAGLGYGGFCFPKDLDCFIHMAKKYNYSFGLLEEVKKINNQQRIIFINKLKRLLNNNLKDKLIVVLGLSFKPNTDDMRESPAIYIINLLLKEGAKINAYDPVATDKAKLIFGSSINYFYDVYEAIKGADAMTIITDWQQFKELDLIRIKKLLKHPIILDGRNIFEPNRLKDLGFIYASIGR